MIDQLFGSKTRVKLLQLFYSNVNRSFYVREITRKIDEQINSVRRELANLLSIGIIKSDNSNNKVYYEVNQKFEFFDPMQELFGVRDSKKRKKPKVKDVAIEIEAAASSDDTDLKALGNLDAVVLMGQFTRDETSGIDILIVGDVNNAAVQRYVTDLEEKEGKELRYTVFSAEDFIYRKQINDKFIGNVLLSKKQIIFDKAGLLG